jgi:hypothetical protein
VVGVEEDDMKLIIALFLVCLAIVAHDRLSIWREK